MDTKLALTDAMTPPDPSFMAHQRAFTAFVRDPRSSPPPADVVPARMRAYRELLYKNIDGSFSACFPVLKAILGPTRWDEMVHRFFSHHRCRTPIYRELPGELLHWFDATGGAGDLPPFARELAHYEWIELALAIDPARMEDVAADSGGDLVTGVPVVSPLARVLDYAFPVHRLSPEYAPTKPPPERTYLVVYRDRGDVVRFMELNSLAAQLLRGLHDASTSGAEALARVARAHPQLDANVVQAGGTGLLRDLRERDVILGTQP